MRRIFRKFQLGLAFVGMFCSATVKAEDSVDASTLTGKVMCGYQGWFNAAGDGAGRGFTHWARGGKRPKPGNITFDLWPDLREFGKEEKFPTDFKHADGSVAHVFSSNRKATVMRHFQWMREYGIDGVFLQRFASTLRNPAALKHNDSVLSHCRSGAKANGRAYALMYDLSGLRRGKIDLLIEDWKKLVKETGLTSDNSYLKHRGKPVLALWGCGFADDKNRPSLDDWGRLLDFLKNDPAGGKPTIMLGVPSYWRMGKRDALGDAKLRELLKKADVISPWSVGRYRDAKSLEVYRREVWKPDLAWCAKEKIDYLPVAFPGFSWHNLQKTRGKSAAVASIPRRKGKFFWSQVEAAKADGAKMLYVAMFDEVDEGTAIFKCLNAPPAGGEFADYEGLPSDHYLKLAGKAARFFSGEGE